MEIADLMRKLADIIDSAGQSADPGQPDAKIQNPAELEPINVGAEVEQPHNQDVAAGDDQMVPPLQLKLELLKRAVGVDNIYNDERSDEVCDEPQAGEDMDELDIIKKRAGLGPEAVVVSAMSDDEPMDD